ALLWAGQPQEVLADDVVVHREPRAVRARPGHLLVQDEVEPVVLVPAAAVLLVDVDTEQPGPARGQPHVAGDDAVLLPLLVIGRDLFGDERADHVTERVVLAGENVSLHCGQSTARGYAALGSGR